MRLPPSLGTPAAQATGTSTTINSTAITGVTSTSNLFVGMAISGTNIPAGSVITAITSPTTLTISEAATATTAGTVALTFGSNSLNMVNGTINAGTSLLVPTPITLGAPATTTSAASFITGVTATVNPTITTTLPTVSSWARW